MAKDKMLAQLLCTVCKFAISNSSMVFLKKKTVPWEQSISSRFLFVAFEKFSDIWSSLSDV